MKKAFLVLATALFMMSFYSCETETVAETNSVYKDNLINEDASDKDEEPDENDRDS